MDREQAGIRLRGFFQEKEVEMVELGWSQHLSGWGHGKYFRQLKASECPGDKR